MTVGAAPLDGRYELLAAAGETRRATRWRARDLRVGRDVVVTLLRPEAAAADRTLARRFTDAATRAAAISHPNLVTILDVGAAKGRRYVVTELVRGPTAADLALVLGTLAPPAAVDLIGMAAHALGAAHRAGMIHGRVVPASLWTGRRGVVVRVAGLGVAAVVDDGVDAGPGLRIATLPFGAPEQLRGRPILPAADVYALGAVLYRLLAGRTPWPPGPAGVAAGRLRGIPRPPSALRPGLPVDLDEIVLRALAVDPVDRYPDGEALAAALGAWEPATDADPGPLAVPPISGVPVARGVSAAAGPAQTAAPRPALLPAPPPGPRRAPAIAPDQATVSPGPGGRAAAAASGHAAPAEDVAPAVGAARAGSAARGGSPARAQGAAAEVAPAAAEGLAVVPAIAVAGGPAGGGSAAAGSAAAATPAADVTPDAAAPTLRATAADSGSSGVATSEGAAATRGAATTKVTTQGAGRRLTPPRSRLVLGAALWLVAMVVLALVGFGIVGPSQPSGAAPVSTVAPTPAAVTP